jgi:hypothetical protein
MSPSKRILRYFLGKPAYLSLSSGALPPPKGHLTLEKGDAMFVDSLRLVGQGKKDKADKK